jgi:hypothetical protein
MRMKFQIIGLVFAAALTLLGTLALGGGRQRFILLDRTVIRVRRDLGKPEFSIDGGKYDKSDPSFQLAEIHLHASPKHRVVVFLDEESARFCDIAFVTNSAVNAGFTDIDFYVVFQKSGTMAQLVYGAVEKLSDNPSSRSRDKRHDAPNDQADNLGANQN